VPDAATTDTRVPCGRRAPRPVSWAVLGAVSAGGVLGALARYGLTVALPHETGAFPWGTFTVNVTGCLLIGVLMALLTGAGRARPLVRPFLGVGVLGGFTTFSTYIVDVQELVTAGAAATGLAYLAATPVAALAAVYTGTRLVRREGG
jgi:fluoride exporter